MAYLNALSTATLSDEELIVLVDQRDEQALALLYDRYQRLVYSVALRITKDTSTAEEVVQDVFYATWLSAKSFQTGRSVRSWLVGITRHRAIDATRTRSYKLYSSALTLTELSSVASDETIDAITRALVVREALASLPLEQRQVLELIFYKGLTSQAIATVLGEPVGTVKGRVRLGLQKLYTLFQSW